MKAYGVDNLKKNRLYFLIEIFCNGSTKEGMYTNLYIDLTKIRYGGVLSSIFAKIVGGGRVLYSPSFTIVGRKIVNRLFII